MENQDKNHTDEPIPKNHFTPNSRYFTILVYALAFVLGAILIYIFIGHFNVTLRLIGQITHLLSPFITGAFIAFVLYPLVHPICWQSVLSPFFWYLSFRRYTKV